jgi:hypothetical protein
MGVGDHCHDPTVGAIRMVGGETGYAGVQLHQTGLEQGPIAGLCGYGNKNLDYFLSAKEIQEVTLSSVIIHNNSNQSSGYSN